MTIAIAIAIAGPRFLVRNFEQKFKVRWNAERFGVRIEMIFRVSEHASCVPEQEPL